MGPLKWITLNKIIKATSSITLEPNVKAISGFGAPSLVVLITAMTYNSL
jgi:hypothetical protein